MANLQTMQDISNNNKSPSFKYEFFLETELPAKYYEAVVEQG